MTDLQKVELAARRLAQRVTESLWIGKAERQFMANTFIAFADEIRDMRKPSFEPEPGELQE